MSGQRQSLFAESAEARAARERTERARGLFGELLNLDIEARPAVAYAPDVAATLAGLSYDWRRESGISLAQFQREREEAALFSPETFIRRRNEAIAQAEAESAVEASRVYNQFINQYQYPTDLAKQIASKAAMASLSIRLDEISAMYGGQQYGEAKSRPIVLTPQPGADANPAPRQLGPGVAPQGE